MSGRARTASIVALVCLLAAAVGGAAAERLARRHLVLEPLPFPPGEATWSSGTYQLAPADPPAGGPVDFRHYPTFAEIEEFCRELVRMYPGVVRLTEAGRSYEGRPVLLLTLGSTAAGDPDTRPALELDGQHHAREPVGQQAALYTAWHLASLYGRDPLATHLLNTRTLYVMPCVNPDGNEIFIGQHWAQRKNARPTDDDGDGRRDEDPYDGVYGWDVCEAVELTFAPSWLRAHPEDPFAPGWGYSLIKRTGLGFYDLGAGVYVPQVDDDRDGRFNEDRIGGVDLNRNYPAGWVYCSNQPASLVYRGPEPFSEPETRAVRDVVVSHPNIRLAVSYHSGDDRLAIPGTADGRLIRDAELLERVGIKASELTETEGYDGTRHQYGTGLAPGETRTWLYERGVLAWLVEAYVDTGPVHWVWSDRAAGRAVAYLHTGLRFNPAPEGLLSACRRWLPFNLYLLAAVPCPRPGLPAAAEGVLRVPVFNDGLVPVEVSVEALLGRDQVSLGRRNLGRLGPAGTVAAWRLGVPELTPEDELTLVITAGAPSLENPSPGLTGVYTWIPGQAPVAAGSPWPVAAAGAPAGEFLRLGDAFGIDGWDADPARWDTDRYHMSNRVRPPQVVP